MKMMIVFSIFQQHILNEKQHQYIIYISIVTVWELQIRAGQQHAVQKKVRFLSWLFMYFQCKSYISSTDKRYIIGMGSGQINQEAGLMPGSSKRRLFKIPMTSVFPICNYSLDSCWSSQNLKSNILNKQRGVHFIQRQDLIINHRAMYIFCKHIISLRASRT